MMIKIKQVNELPREFDLKDVESWELIPGKPGRVYMRSGDVIDVTADQTGYLQIMLRQGTTALDVGQAPKPAPAPVAT